MRQQGQDNFNGTNGVQDTFVFTLRTSNGAGQSIQY